MIAPVPDKSPYFLTNSDPNLSNANARVKKTNGLSENNLPPFKILQGKKENVSDEVTNSPFALKSDDTRNKSNYFLIGKQNQLTGNLKENARSFKLTSDFSDLEFIEKHFLKKPDDFRKKNDFSIEMKTEPDRKREGTNV